MTISTAGEAARAFVPSPLPPIPSIEWSSEFREKFDQALLTLGRLDLELFLHDLPEKTPVIVKAALAHVQFETIHPFPERNLYMELLTEFL